ncbi:hypothetical protein FBY21_5271 [Pseudomonas sp. SLBN-26]|jgi:hypothetical protein|uniref:Uncharacterized protein n=1 Tax=Metapseudomonas otitidis TaxID=319939 RepID=A0A1I0UR05_9GAMM|nr:MULTISPECIES: hypothetical protein [Pseudomonas]MDL5601345.1 hypothetical protein [Bacillus subtilis]KIV74917.1 hypothetical protein SZ55_0274 [Pseudomonas sp. FeS53a]MBO2930913.1 hypothetical protein [Pseudomonas otitidis]MCO7555368.1 hypothetical protein [Pseudomonas otitidis]MCP1620623.1 hypothetical protein [Pseudomonas otitidis]
MQLHEGVCRAGDVVSINILDGEPDERVMRLLLTQGIEVEVLEVLEGAVKLAVRAPGGMLIVEELTFPP